LQRSMAIGRVWFAERSEIPLPDLRASNNGRRSFSGDGGFDRKDRPLETAFHIRNNPRLVSGAKLAPQGRFRKAQGASPGNKDSNKGSPEGAMQLVPVPKRRLMTSIYLELRSNSLRRPFRAGEFLIIVKTAANCTNFTKGSPQGSAEKI